jgi:hypothetical protein
VLPQDSVRLELCRFLKHMTHRGGSARAGRHSFKRNGLDRVEGTTFGQAP